MRGLGCAILFAAGLLALLTALMRIWAAHVKNHEWALVTDSGHAINWEQPDAFNEAVRGAALMASDLPHFERKDAISALIRPRNICISAKATEAEAKRSFKTGRAEDGEGSYGSLSTEPPS